MNVYIVIALYLIIVNIVGFALMGNDKKRARKHMFRIPEAALFTVAIIGGSLGSIIGMKVFRHKTRHWYFTYGIPFILLLQIAVIILIHFSPVTVAFL